MKIHHNYGDLISAVRKGPYEQVKTKYEQTWKKFKMSEETSQTVTQSQKQLEFYNVKNFTHNFHAIMKLKIINTIWSTFCSSFI